MDGQASGWAQNGWRGERLGGSPLCASLAVFSDLTATLGRRVEEISTGFNDSIPRKMARSTARIAEGWLTSWILSAVPDHGV